MESGILLDNSFVVADKDEAPRWIINYYADSDTEVSLNPVNEVAQEFTIWEVRSANGHS